MKSTKCHECWVLGGKHASHCQSRGYSAVGPHPDAPKAAPPKPAGPLPQCPCGIARLDCEYHRTPAAEREYKVYDAKAEDDPAVWDAAIDCGDWAGAAHAWGFSLWDGTTYFVDGGCYVAGLWP